MLKRALMYYRMPCARCEETLQFLEDNGVTVSARDIAKDPLTKNELSSIVGYLNPKHYVNPGSPAFTKNGLDEKLPPREELLEMIEQCPDLLRHPIVVTGRLMTIGSNRRQLVDMLQLNIGREVMDSSNGGSRNSRH